MYLFYCDESGTRDPEVKRDDRADIYVLLAVGIPVAEWKAFDLGITNFKLELIERLKRDKSNGENGFTLDQCEVKANWLRNPNSLKRKSDFLKVLESTELTTMADLYFKQATKKNTVILASIIDKRHLNPGTTGEEMHQTAYEFLLERVQHFMHRQRGQKAFIVMDDIGRKTNQAVALTHAHFQHRGNKHMEFPSIVEYPFFVYSELSNGVQLADLLAYTVFHAFAYNKPDYKYLVKILPKIASRDSQKIEGLKIWPKKSNLSALKKQIEQTHQKEPTRRKATQKSEKER